MTNTISNSHQFLVKSISISDKCERLCQTTVFVDRPDPDDLLHFLSKVDEITIPFGKDFCLFYYFISED